MAFHMRKGIGPQGLGAPKSVAKQATDTKIKDLPKVIGNKAEEVKDKVVEGGKKLINKIGNIKISTKEGKERRQKIKQIRKEGKEHNKNARKTEGTRVGQFIRKHTGKNKATPPSKKAKPDFLDLDNDGNTTEPMKSAVKQLTKFREDKGKKPRPQSLHGSAKGKKIGKDLKSGRSEGEKPKGAAKQTRAYKKAVKLEGKAEGAVKKDKMNKNMRVVKRHNKLVKRKGLDKKPLASG